MLTKRLIFLLVFTLVIYNFVYAHSGGTDGNDGHYNRKTGTYHYHKHPHVLVNVLVFVLVVVAIFIWIVLKN